MNETQHYGQETRQRLLDVACELFAEVGYEQTTLVLISERAKANKAAVNYHFRSKEALYQECWRMVLRRANEVHPPDGGVAADAPAEERLRGRIRAILARMADPANREFLFFSREMTHPTGLLAEVVRECLEPMHRGFGEVVAEMLGPRATPLHRDLCLRSIMGQCLDLMAMERMRAASPNPNQMQGPPPLNADLETVIEHITDFSLAGIHEIRRKLEAAPSPRSGQHGSDAKGRKINKCSR